MASPDLLASKIVTKEEPPSIRSVTPASQVLFALGITMKGPVRTPSLSTSFEEWVTKYGSFISDGALALQIRQFFLNGGSQVWTSRAVHYTDITNPATKTSVAATGSLNTAAGGETQGEVISGNAGPYNLEPAQILTVRGQNDGVGFGPTNVQFDAAAGFAVTNEAAAGAGGAEPFALVNGDTLIIAVDGGANQTVTFDTGEFVAIGAATAEEVAAVINGELVGAKATVTGGGTTVTITSDKRGTGGIINVVGGSAAGAAKLDLSVGVGGTHTGTGHAANIDAVTTAEAVARIAAVLAANVSVADDGSGKIRIRSTGFGTDSNVKVDGGSANTAFGFDLATHSGFAAGATATLRVDGKYDGDYANGFIAEVQNATSGVTTEFNLVIKDSAGIILETFPNLTLDNDAAVRYAETIVNADVGGSVWVSVVDLDALRASQRPANGTVTLASGNDGLSGIVDADFSGDSAGQTGLRAFDIVAGGTLLVCPDRATAAVQNAMITFCEVTRNLEMSAILDPPAGLSSDSMITYKASLTGSEHFDIYWPRVKIPNPSVAVFGSAEMLTVPPSGSLAGMFCRTASTQPEGAFAQPVGVENGRLFGVSDVENDDVLREEIRDKVFPQRINPIIFTKDVGVHPDGARTGKGTGNFPSIGERLGVSFVELSLKQSLLFAKNQPNTPDLRRRVRKTIDGFLRGLTQNGCFASKDPAEAYTLDVDVPGKGLNSADVVRAGKLNIRIGLATAAPAEFIILLVTRDTRALDEAAAARVG